jgi:hypothetical protein
MVYQGNQLEVMRMAPKRPALELPFGMWMTLAKATPLQMSELDSWQETLPDQS